MTLLLACSLKLFQSDALKVSRHGNSQLPLRLLVGRRMNRTHREHRHSGGRTNRKQCALEIGSLTICHVEVRSTLVKAVLMPEGYRDCEAPLRHPCRCKMSLHKRIRRRGNNKLGNKRSARKKMISLTWS